MITARTVKTVVPLSALTVAAIVTAWRADVRHLEGFAFGAGVCLALEWAAERLWEGAQYK
ncbi:hypothetical protein GZH49_01655 [Nocardia terpenica]|uniref:hypothetical protein n=1 Tax=Nocardia terpenica TaxID=455432 RepID=UPI002FE1EA8D